MEGMSPSPTLGLQWIQNKTESKNTGPSLRVALGLLTSTEPQPRMLPGKACQGHQKLRWKNCAAEPALLPSSYFTGPAWGRPKARSRLRGIPVSWTPGPPGLLYVQVSTPQREDWKLRATRAGTGFPKPPTTNLPLHPTGSGHPETTASCPLPAAESSKNRSRRARPLHVPVGSWLPRSPRFLQLRTLLVCALGCCLLGRVHRASLSRPSRRHSQPAALAPAPPCRHPPVSWERPPRHPEMLHSR